MKHKNFLIFLIMLVMITGMVSAADTSILKTTLLRYEPVPAEPGDYITVYVQIENIGNANADSVSIRFKDVYPFSIDDASEFEKIIGTLSTNQAYVTDFKIRIDDKAITGTNEIKFEISDDFRNQDFTEKVFNINIQSRDTELNINNVIVEPKNLNPGKEGKISVSLKNDAYSSITSISLQLSLFDLTGVNLPFAITDGVSEKNLNILGVGEEKILEYNIISYPDATPGIYKIPIILTYYDNGGTKYTKADYITLIINPEPKIDIIIDDSELTQEMSSGEISIKVINRGLGDLKFANIQLIESDDYEILSSYDSVYLGNIDSDDYDTADFNIKVDEDQISISVILEYKDSLNNEKVVEKTLNLNVHSTDSNSSGILVKLVGVLIIGGLVYWHIKKHKHKKK